MSLVVLRSTCPYQWCGRVQGKVVFVAPTKPLVSQQIQACYEFMGVSKVHALLSIDAYRKGLKCAVFVSYFLSVFLSFWGP